MEQLLFECAVRSTLIAAATAAVLSGMRIKNAAARHKAWTGVLLLMLALPFWTAFGYRVPLRVLPPALQNVDQVPLFSHAKAPPESPRGGSTPAGVAWPQWIEGIYFFGAAVLLLRLGTGMVGAYRVQRLARLIDGRLTSASCSSPISVGWLRAVTVLPEGWQDWEPAKLAAVLTHEREHAHRRDPLVQWLALVNRAVLWFHPLAWWLERRLAALSEQACDVAVLEQGHDAGTYAKYLLDFARSVNNSRHRVRILGMAMPGRYLPERIQELLSGPPEPQVSVLRMAFAGAVFFLLSAGLSSATLVGAQNRNTTGIGAEIIVQPANSSVFLALSENPMPLEIGDKLRQLPGLKAVAPVMIKMAIGNGITVIYGIDSHFTDVTGGFDIREGALFKAPDEIVVDDIWAAAHALKPGDRTTILSREFKVSGVVEHGQGARIYMSMDALSNAVGGLNGAGAFFVKLQDPDQVKAAIAQIEQTLPEYTVRDVLDFATLMNR